MNEAYDYRHQIKSTYYILFLKISIFACRLAKLITGYMHDWISQIVTNIFFITWVGAICGHILSLYAPNFYGTKPFLRQMFPEKSDTFYFRLDFLILPIIGAAIAFNLIEPTSIKASLFSGLSWSGSLGTILNINVKKQPKGK